MIRQFINNYKHLPRVNEGSTAIVYRVSHDKVLRVETDISGLGSTHRSASKGCYNYSEYLELTSCLINLLNYNQLAPKLYEYLWEEESGTLYSIHGYLKGYVDLSEDDDDDFVADKVEVIEEALKKLGVAHYDLGCLGNNIMYNKKTQHLVVVDCLVSLGRIR